MRGRRIAANLIFKLTLKFTILVSNFRAQFRRPFPVTLIPKGWIYCVHLINFFKTAYSQWKPF